MSPNSKVTLDLILQMSKHWNFESNPEPFSLSSTLIPHITRTLAQIFLYESYLERFIVDAVSEIKLGDCLASSLGVHVDMAPDIGHINTVKKNLI